MRVATFVVVCMLIVFSRWAHSEEVDTSDWNCDLCSRAEGWDVLLSGGTGFVIGDSFDFGTYNGMDETGIFIAGDLFARYWNDDAFYVRLDSTDLGLDSRSLSVRSGKQGSYEFRAAYQGIPHRIFDSTVTPYSSAGSRSLVLPQAWVQAPTTAGMTALDSSLNKVDIKHDWDIYQIGSSFDALSNWAFDVDYRRRERDGNLFSSAGFFFDAVNLAKPIDDATDELELSAIYTAETWHVSARYVGSFYENDIDSLTWDNPFTPQTPGADTGRMSLAPDNDAHQFTVAGAIRLPMRTTLNGHLSIGKMEQDESLLPYTSNAQIVTNPLPRNAADMEVDTTSFSVKATAVPIKKLTVQGEYRYNERDNDSSTDVYDYVVTDLINSANPAANIAYGYERTDIKLRGEYRFSSRARLHAGYNYEEFERNAQERRDTDTDHFWSQIKLRPTDWSDIDIKVYTEERDGSSYNPITNVPTPQNSLMRKYNMADRDRTGYKTYVSIYPGDQYSFGFIYEYNDDDYDNSDIGLQKSEYTSLGVDGSYLLMGKIPLYGSYYTEEFESRQANSQAFANPDWSADTKDKFYNGTLGVSYPDLFGRIGLTVEYTYSKSEGEISNNTNGLASDFPDLETERHAVKIGLDYARSEALSYTIDYIYDRYKTDDWALDGVEPDTVPNLLALGAESDNSVTHMVILGVTYRFDSRRGRRRGTH